jgi:hypothetical protein
MEPIIEVKNLVKVFHSRGKDSMAFLSTITPGNTTVTHVKIKADDAAVPKAYGIDTVLKYETPEGDIKYSDILQALVEEIRQDYSREHLDGFNEMIKLGRCRP